MTLNLAGYKRYVEQHAAEYGAEEHPCADWGCKDIRSLIDEITRLDNLLDSQIQLNENAYRENSLLRRSMLTLINMAAHGAPEEFDHAVDELVKVWDLKEDAVKK